MGGPLEGLKVLDIATVPARFAGNGERVKRARELNEIFSAWCAEHTIDEVLAKFAAEQGTIALIYSIDQIADDPQAKARDDHAQLRNSAGDVGQDNREVYRDWLGLSEEQLDQLARRNVI